MKELVEAGLERKGEARARFVDQACADDPSLRAEVVELIASFERAGHFMAIPAAEIPTPLVSDDPAESLAGQRIGPYEVVKRIGQGGMGTVWLGSRADEAFHKTVAIKVIKRGMDSDAIIRAFRTERQILATLDHPNVAPPRWGHDRRRTTLFRHGLRRRCAAGRVL
jgi:hypothetical protein